LSYNPKLLVGHSYNLTLFFAKFYVLLTFANENERYLTAFEKWLLYHESIKRLSVLELKTRKNNRTSNAMDLL